MPRAAAGAGVRCLAACQTRAGACQAVTSAALLGLPSCPDAAWLERQRPAPAEVAAQRRFNHDHFPEELKGLLSTSARAAVRTRPVREAAQSEAPAAAGGGGV